MTGHLDVVERSMWFLSGASKPNPIGLLAIALSLLLPIPSLGGGPAAAAARGAGEVAIIAGIPIVLFVAWLLRNLTPRDCAALLFVAMSAGCGLMYAGELFGLSIASLTGGFMTLTAFWTMVAMFPYYIVANLRQSAPCRDDSGQLPDTECLAPTASVLPPSEQSQATDDLGSRGTIERFLIKQEEPPKAETPSPP